MMNTSSIPPAPRYDPSKHTPATRIYPGRKEVPPKGLRKRPLQYYHCTEPSEVQAPQPYHLRMMTEVGQEWCGLCSRMFDEETPLEDRVMCEHNNLYDNRSDGHRLACRRCVLVRCTFCRVNALENNPRSNGRAQIRVDKATGLNWCMTCIVMAGGGICANEPCKTLLTYEYVEDTGVVHCQRCMLDPANVKWEEERRAKRSASKDSASRKRISSADIRAVTLNTVTPLSDAAAPML